MSGGLTHEFVGGGVLVKWAGSIEQRFQRVLLGRRASAGQHAGRGVAYLPSRMRRPRQGQTSSADMRLPRRPGAP